MGVVLTLAPWGSQVSKKVHQSVCVTDKILHEGVYEQLKMTSTVV